MVNYVNPFILSADFSVIGKMPFGLVEPAISLEKDKGGF
jgi:hypothetical protein